MAFHMNEKLKLNLDPIIKDINNGFRVLVILRGLPGSGKSTLARYIVSATVGNSEYTHVLSTDDYFLINGVYKYDIAKLSDAHMWNQRRADQYMKQGISPIIIDNTNCEAWEMRPYAVFGVNNGYIIKVLESGSSWSFIPTKLSQMNSHGVGLVKIKKMMEKYQKNITADYLFKLFDLKYPSHFNSAILRTAPPLSQQAATNQTPKNGLVQASGSSCVPRSYSAIKTSSSSDNFHVDNDLIDLSDSNDWVITENPNNFGSDKNIRFTNNILQQNYLSSFSSMEESDLCPNMRNLAPKSQRISNKNSPMKLNDSSNLSTNYNWEPIDETFSSWNTHDFDFLSISQNKVSDQNKIENREVATDTSGFNVNLESDKILFGRNKNINSSNVPSPSTPKNKLTLDKGVMTIEENYETVDLSRNESMSHLKALFNDIPEDYMFDMLTKCNGNLNWAVELLLDAKNESNFTDLSEFQTPEIKKTAEIKDNEIIVIDENDKKIGKNTTKNDSKFTKISKKDKNPSEYSVELKKQIEEQFQFSDDHYSKHSLELKRKIHGECSSSHMNDLVEEHEYPHKRSSSESSDEPDTNTISFRMGRDFFAQLDKIYGMDIAWDDKLEPIIHIPESLVNQIHALWLESVCNQIDVYKENMRVLMHEDEELARELELKEKQLQGEEPTVGNLVDIMEMEIAFANYNAKVSQWEQSPEDLASKLTRQKLSQMFPEIEEDTLLEVYKAHNNNFEQTFHLLLLNTGKISPSQTEGIDQKAVKKLLAEMEKELLERANREKEKDLIPDIFNESIDSLNIVHLDGSVTEISNKMAVQYLRQQALHHLQIRNKNFNKARECINKGMVSAASYYSQIAGLHAKKHDFANNLAASRLLQVSSSGTDNFTLDLHHLYVPEALQVLDMFLDKHISELKAPDCKTYMTKLFLITGRGRHSPGGQARIKPAVKKRLMDRGLQFSLINPGLLGVTVSARDYISTASNVS